MSIIDVSHKAVSRKPATRKTCSFFRIWIHYQDHSRAINGVQLAREGILPHFTKLQVTNGSGDVFCLQSSFDVPATASFMRAVYTYFLAQVMTTRQRLP